MPILTDFESCCGCSACANKCARNAITMQPMGGGKFLHPIIDNTLCVECGLCEKACPALISNVEPVETQRAYLVQHKDEIIRYQSTSGGAFTAIAQEILDAGGVVYGATMTDNYVHHVCVTTVDGLKQFRNSKYVQSDLANTFRDISNKLNDGILVCFSGTPCQVSGLKTFLGRSYDNLITIDVVCHAVPSPFIFSKYVELIKGRIPNAHQLVFRDKYRGYSYSTMSWYDKDGKNVYRASLESDEWYRLFLRDKCDRGSCYSCKYQNQARMSDITIWDCYNAHDLCPSMDDNKGTTNVIVWSQKGLDVFHGVSKSARVQEIDVNLTIKSTAVHKRNRPNWNEDQFYADANELPVEEFFGKYVPQSHKTRISSSLRYILWLLGLHDIIRRRIQKRRS